MPARRAKARKGLRKRVFLKIIAAIEHPPDPIAVSVGRVRALRCLTISWSSSLAWVTLPELLVAVVLRRGIAVL
jgi:hypothetical protein